MYSFHIYLWSLKTTKFQVFQIASSIRVPYRRKEDLSCWDWNSTFGGDIRNSMSWVVDENASWSGLIPQFLVNHRALAKSQWIKWCIGDSASDSHREHNWLTWELNRCSLSLVGRTLAAILQRVIFTLSWIFNFHISAAQIPLALSLIEEPLWS